jgi:hypothetical protein
MPPENHYELLGIEPTAPLPAVRTALERLEDQANRLAYTSPDRSRELWARIRQIRDDLLAGSERRRAYDASLQRTRVPILTTIERTQPATSPPMPESAGTAVSPPVPASRGVETGASRAVPIWPLLVAAAVVAVTLVLAFALHRPVAPRAHRVTYHAPPAPAGLEAGGFRKGAGFVSGKRITLTWHSVPDAALYHVQVASQSGAGSGFQHPVLSVTTEATSYSLKLPGERRYIWRVQALIAGRWTPRARFKSFLVARPGTSAPQPHPSPASSIRNGHARLCWSAVPWAVAYLLRVQPATGGEQMLTVHSTCQTVTEKPGGYSWTVAGLIRGVRTYAGPFSVVEHFSVLAPSTAAAICAGRYGHPGCRQGDDRVMGVRYNGVFHVLSCDKIKAV